MKNGQRYWIPAVAAVTAALIGLIGLQVFLLMESFEQKEQAFDRTVMNALTAVAQQIERKEAAAGIFTVAMTPKGPPVDRSSVRKRSRTPEETQHMTYSWVIADSVTKDSGKQMRVEVFHGAGVETLRSVVIRKPAAGRTAASGYSYTVDSSGMRINIGMSDSMHVVLKDTSRKRRVELVSKVVDKLFLFESLPIERRVDPAVVDSLIGTSLRAAGIDIPFHFRITVGAHDSVRVKSEPEGGIEEGAAPYSTVLFPNDVVSPRYRLSVFLPERSSVVLEQMALVLGLSVLFIAIVIASFVYTVRMMVRQQRFSLSVVGFINNMTHEFKTPISTIALAVEAILKPEVLKSRTKLRTYTALIADENSRMKHQVETILQMAVLERGEFEPKMEEVDLHTLVRKSVQNIALIVGQRNGAIRMELNAVNAVVRGDAHHLANVVRNLLDNAVKYSPAAPEITVSSIDGPDGVTLRITDRGIGIAPEDLGRVFEPYFRVSNGDTHDVKGFGLGLSYVKRIVEAHRGVVRIDSTVGAGTTIEVVLPQ